LVICTVEILILSLLIQYVAPSPSVPCLPLFLDLPHTGHFKAQKLRSELRYSRVLRDRFYIVLNIKISVLRGTCQIIPISSSLKLCQGFFKKDQSVLGF
jgi:hypothetical protein